MIEDLCLKNIRGGIAKCLCEEEEEWEYEGNSLVLHGNSEVREGSFFERSKMKFLFGNLISFPLLGFL